VKIIIGVETIEVPQFIADATVAAGHAAQFGAFLKQVLDAQSRKVRSKILEEEKKMYRPFDELTNFMEGLKRKK
jgi:phosphoribosylcarboxyaminoimidazole (NCAIR) mutase